MIAKLGNFVNTRIFIMHLVIPGKKNEISYTTWHWLVKIHWLEVGNQFKVYGFENILQDRQGFLKLDFNPIVVSLPVVPFR